MSLGYAAVQKEGVGIAVFTDLGSYAFPVHHPLHDQIVEAVKSEKALIEFDHLLEDEPFKEI